MISGLDTESIIKELMSAQSTKKTKVQNKITTLEWKQEKWKDMNTKIYSFYTGSLSKSRFQSSYQTKKATSSNETKLEVSASSTATQGTHSIKVKELASAQFATGGKLGSDVTGDTKLVDLGFDATTGASITVATGDKFASLDVGKYTTINDVIQTCKDAGINATFDKDQKRFFLSSSDTGVKNAFTMTMTESDAAKKRNAIRDEIGYNTMSSAEKSSVDKLLAQYKLDVNVSDDFKAIEADLQKLRINTVSNTVRDEFKKNEANVTAARDAARATLEAKLSEGEEVDAKELEKLTETNLDKDATEHVQAILKEYQDGVASADNPYKTAADQLTSLLVSYKSSDDTMYGVNSQDGLSKLGLVNLTDVMTDEEKKAVSFVEASDCTVIYNNAEIKSSSNTISANGLTFTAKQITAGMNTEDTSDDEVINISISNDVDGVYDMIKTFFKDYNELLKGMNTAYNADSARGYDPLTDDEKEAMSDTEVEKWETKIKDALLRRDDQLSSVISAMRTAMSGSVEVNGKSYSLSSFGIGTTDYTEKGLLHIAGDKDDAKTSSESDKLRVALEKDPDTVMQVMAKLAEKLYSSITDKMSTSSLSSALTVYNDKEMKSQLKDYKSDLSDLEDKLKDIENRYYKQFSAMETAMSKLNAQTSSLQSLMGISNN